MTTLPMPTRPTAATLFRAMMLALLCQGLAAWMCPAYAAGAPSPRAAQASENQPPAPAPIAEQHLACSTDSDCTIIQRTCGGCGPGSPVSRKYQEIYLQKAKTRCANFWGIMCDRRGPLPVAVCSAGKCAAK